jgi:hypothetical protein
MLRTAEEGKQKKKVLTHQHRSSFLCQDFVRWICAFSFRQPPFWYAQSFARLGRRTLERVSLGPHCDGIYPRRMEHLHSSSLGPSSDFLHFFVSRLLFCMASPRLGPGRVASRKAHTHCPIHHIGTASRRIHLVGGGCPRNGLRDFGLQGRAQLLLRMFIVLFFYTEELFDSVPVEAFYDMKMLTMIHDKSDLSTVCYACLCLILVLPTVTHSVFWSVCLCFLVATSLSPSKYSKSSEMYHNSPTE